MALTRIAIRNFFAALVAVYAGCAVGVAHADHVFKDDAKREVPLPDKIARVFAAGAPAELLLYTLAPEKLVGRNHMPSAAAQEFMPQEFRAPLQIMRLPNSQNDQNDAELLALKPDAYIDYGDVTEDYVVSVSNVQQRTGIPSIILDGDLEHIPAVYRRLGAALGVKDRGESLARETERLLKKYRGLLKKSGATPRVYMACSADSSIPCLEDDSSGQAAKLLGAVNVAGAAETALQRSVTVDDMKIWNPDAVIALNEDAAARFRQDPAWQSIKAVANHRVYAPPSVPFNWGPRPPSVNRLMGMIWLAYTLPGRAFDSEFYEDMRRFFKIFYHFTPSDEQIRRIVGR